MPIKQFLAAVILNLTLCTCWTYSLAQTTFEFDNSVPVFANDMELSMPWAGGINAGQYQSIDLNRDGENDLVIFDRTSIKVNTFIWEDGGYAYDPDYEDLFPDDLNAWLIIVDFNCDGIEDLISSSVFGMKAYVGSLDENELVWNLSIDPVSTEGFSSQVNLQVNSADIPAIVDIDGDGDLDIFVFNFARGGTIEFHQNLSMENTGNCGLEFKRVDSVWGDFEECTCGVYALGTTCAEIAGRNGASPEKTLHAGGKSLLLFDYDGDGDKDMLFGDEECNNLAYFENTPTNDEADFTSYLIEFPETAPATYTFPASYLLDTDHDGLQDLIIAPNLADNDGKNDFIHSSSVYKNVGTAEQYQFQKQKDNFLQDRMIEVGFSAAAALHDVDNDGRTDMVIGNAGNPTEGRLVASLTYYKNTGTDVQPAFTLQTDDFLNLSTAGLTNIRPGFADLTGDGVKDLYFSGTTSDGSGALYYVPAGNGGLAENAIPISIAVELGSGDTPVLGALNDDEFADMVISRSSGRFDYYESSVVNGSVGFKLVQENLAGFTAKFENRNLTPALFDVDHDGVNELIISNAKGQLFIIEDMLNHQSGLEGSKALNIVNKKWDNSSQKGFGFGSSIAFGFIFEGESASMLVGSRQGGVYLLRNKSGVIHPGEESLALNCFPIPSAGILNVEVSEAASIVLYNLLGEIVWKEMKQAAGVRHEYSTSGLSSGVYIMKAVGDKGQRRARKIIVL